jgi:hypothetical protein
MTTPADDLAEHVAAHMTTHFPDSTEVGGWAVARDLADGSAAVIWRPDGSTLTTPAVRGQLLTSWLEHLRCAGFVGEALTDRSVFSGPQPPDGYVCWLHITGQSSRPAST